MSSRSKPVRGAAGSRGAQPRPTKKKKRVLTFWVSGAVVALAGVGGLLLSRQGSPQSPQATNGQPLVSSRMGSPSAAGLLAPNGSFTTTFGQNISVSSLRGKPTLIWFVATWCTSCQAGTQAMAQNLPTLQKDGVRVVEVELYHDLGQPGQGISSFGRQLAGSQYGNPNWIFASSSASLTQTYDPHAYLDIYYLLNSKGKISYVNASPSSTMPSLLSKAATTS